MTRSILPASTRADVVHGFLPSLSVTLLLLLVDPRADRGHSRRYSRVVVDEKACRSAELLTVSFRYKQPTASESRLLSVVVKDRNTAFGRASENFRFSAAVAEFGMLLRDSEEKGRASMEHVIRTADAARGEDPHGYRAEFVSLAEMAATLTGEDTFRPEVGVR